MQVRRFGLITALLLVAGCSSTSTADVGDGDYPAGIHGTVNGEIWSSTIQDVLMEYTASSHSYAIVADVPSANVIVISLEGIAEPGTYSLGPGMPRRYSEVSIPVNTYETSTTTSNGAHVIIDIATPTRLKGHLIYNGTPAASTPSATGTVSVDVTFDLTTTKTNS